MQCIKCGKNIPDDAKLCCYCGVKLNAAAHVRAPKRRGNGQGTVYKLPNGRYAAVVTLGMYTGDDGKVHRRTRSRQFAKKTDAVNALAELSSVQQAVTDMSLHALHELYTSSKEYDALSSSQRDKLTYAWNRWKRFEFRGIATLTVDDLQSCVDAETNTYYPAKDMKVILSHLYKIAVRKEIVSYNKTEYIDLPDPPTPKLECWTRNEIAAMWSDYAAHPVTGYVLIMCYAGLRYGELATIQLDNIHLEEDYMIGGIKTEAGINREIPIAAKVKPIVSRFIAEGRRKKLLEMNEDNFYREYWCMVDRTGIRALPPQTCRHYYFSSMTAAGVQGGVIAKTGGHSSYSTTMKNYVTIPLSEKLRAVNMIE